jgi:hypothetical protein
MNDVIFINQYLDKNYTVITGNLDYLIKDTIDDKSMGFLDFKKVFIKIFGDFKSSEESSTSIIILNSWFNNKKRILNKKLFDLFDEVDDGSLKSLFLLEKIKTICDSDYKYEFHHGFITNVFIEYYKDKYMIHKLENYVKTFNTDFGSVKMMNDFQDDFILEHEKIISFAKEYLNNWYSETVIGSKVKDLLSQLVLTLGSRNWVVTWIGHGPFSKKRLLEKFINESTYHHDYILNMYDKWYGDAVIDASEKVMGRNLGIFSNDRITFQ